MSENAFAFFTGLFGSFHCLGMCGPLAFSVASAQGGWLMIFDKIQYQAGRIISYAFLGILVGVIGKQLWMAGLQQSISIISGTIILFSALALIFRFKFLQNPAANFPITRLLHYALKNKLGHLIIGMLNGLLPCGFVTLALAGAINTGSIITATQFMIFFGLGTSPVMLAATLGIGWMTPLFRRKINKVMPYFMLCLGIWFVLRGMVLDIPYLSPKGESTDGVAVCR